MGRTQGSSPGEVRLHAVAFAAGATLFAAGLLVTEGLGEVALDVDFKPFVIPYLLLTVFPYGMSTLAVGTGAAVGEGLLDVVEGYEFDDPFGFVGYVAGFAAFGWVVHRVAPDPTDRRWQLAAALVGGIGHEGGIGQGVAITERRSATARDGVQAV